LDGTIREVKNSFRPQEFSISLANLSQDLPREWKVLSSEYGVFNFSLSLNGQTPNQLLKELMTFGEVLEFKERIPSMEEIFIHQVKSTSYE
jgi:ABC-2 type transport system ATP-binding protein